MQARHGVMRCRSCISMYRANRSIPGCLVPMHSCLHRLYKVWGAVSGAYPGARIFSATARDPCVTLPSQVKLSSARAVLSGPNMSEAMLSFRPCSCQVSTAGASWLMNSSCADCALLLSRLYSRAAISL